MFNNKKDPVADTIKDIMNRTALRNKVEEALNEQLGVSSRKAIPHEYLAQYDAMLAEQQDQAEKKTRAPTEGDKAEAASLESKKDLPNPIADRLMNQGSYTPSAREGKAVPPLEKLQEKLSPKQKELAGKAGDPNKIEAADLKKLRDETLDEQQLQEKATEAQKEKVARVMREYKKGKLHSGSKKGPKVTDEKQAVAIAMSQAGLSNKKKMDESLQSIQEEIRNNLLEKLNFVYENYGEQAAQYAYDTLNEEERGILGEGLWDWISGGNKPAPQKTDYSRVGRQSALGDDERGKPSVTTFRGGKRTDTELGNRRLDIPVKRLSAPPPPPAAPKTDPGATPKGTDDLGKDLGGSGSTAATPPAASAPATPPAARPTPAASSRTSSLGQELRRVGGNAPATSDTEAGRRKIAVLDRVKPMSNWRDDALNAGGGG